MINIINKQANLVQSVVSLSRMETNIFYFIFLSRFGNNYVKIAVRKKTKNFRIGNNWVGFVLWET